jgi:hypothetical protein
MIHAGSSSLFADSPRRGAGSTADWEKAMPRFLFVFCYETPDELATNPMYGWEEEETKAVFIEARHEEEALRWGREVARAFVWTLFQREGGPQDFEWKPNSYRHWIDFGLPSQVRPEELALIPTIRVGELLDEDGNGSSFPGHVTGTSSRTRNG